MVQLTEQQTLRFQSFEDYLAYDDDSDRLYELFNGELIEVPPESGLNVEIANLFFALFLPIVGHRKIRGHGLELEVQGEPKNRYPDLTIIRDEHIEQLKKRNTIRLSMAPPLLVMEVVSPGAIQRDRDYIAKRSQYEAVGIPEYWLIDLARREMTVFRDPQAGGYRTKTIVIAGEIRPVAFPELAIAVEQIIAP